MYELIPKTNWTETPTCTLTLDKNQYSLAEQISGKFELVFEQQAEYEQLAVVVYGRSDGSEEDLMRGQGLGSGSGEGQVRLGKQVLQRELVEKFQAVVLPGRYWYGFCFKAVQENYLIMRQSDTEFYQLTLAVQLSSKQNTKQLAKTALKLKLKPKKQNPPVHITIDQSLFIKKEPLTKIEESQKQIKEIESRAEEHEIQMQEGCKAEIRESMHKEKYMEFMGRFSGHGDIGAYERQFVEHGISYSQDDIVSGFRIHKIFQSACGQVVNLVVSFSHFAVTVRIVNMEIDSLSQKLLKTIGSGSYGKVYLSKDLDGKTIAVKSVRYEKNFSDTGKLKKTSIQSIIAEYSIFKLFSILRIGPKVLNCFGFDLVIYNDTVEFCMEAAMRPTKISKNDLALELKLMHKLHLIHGDIKPANVMWSPSYQKLVFIDFGFSKCISEEQGYLTRTEYFGTVKFSSPEMISILDTGIGYADLYYNDVFALMRVWEWNFNEILDQQHIQQKKQYRTLLFNLLLQQQLFDARYWEIQKMHKDSPEMQIYDSTIELIKELKPNKLLSKIAIFLITKYRLKSKIATQMLEYTSGKNLKLEIDEGKRERLGMRMKMMKMKTTPNQYFVYYEYNKFWSHQDIGLRAIINKNLQHEKIAFGESTNEAFWHSFVSYVSNLHTIFQQVLETFEKIKPFLRIKEWPKCQHPELQIVTRSFLIRKILLQEHNIDLLEIYEKQRKINSVMFREEMHLNGTLQKHPYKFLSTVYRFDEGRGQYMLHVSDPNPSELKKLMQSFKKIQDHPTFNQFFQLDFQYMFMKSTVIRNKIAKNFYNLCTSFPILQKSFLSLRYFFSEQLCEQTHEMSPMSHTQQMLKTHETYYNYCFVPEIYMQNSFRLKIIQKMKFCFQTLDFQEVFSIVREMSQIAEKFNLTLCYEFYFGFLALMLHYFKYHTQTNKIYYCEELNPLIKHVLEMSKRLYPRLSQFEVLQIKRNNHIFYSEFIISAGNRGKPISAEYFIRMRKDYIQKYKKLSKRINQSEQEEVKQALSEERTKLEEQFIEASQNFCQGVAIRVNQPMIQKLTMMNEFLTVYLNQEQSYQDPGSQYLQFKLGEILQGFSEMYMGNQLNFQGAYDLCVARYLLVVYCTNVKQQYNHALNLLVHTPRLSFEIEQIFTSLCLAQSFYFLAISPKAEDQLLALLNELYCIVTERMSNGLEIGTEPLVLCTYVLQSVIAYFQNDQEIGMLAVKISAALMSRMKESIATQSFYTAARLYLIHLIKSKIKPGTLRTKLKILRNNQYPFGKRAVSWFTRNLVNSPNENRALVGRKILQRLENFNENKKEIVVLDAMSTMNLSQDQLRAFQRKINMCRELGFDFYDF